MRYRVTDISIVHDGHIVLHVDDMRVNVDSFNLLLA